MSAQTPIAPSTLGRLFEFSYNVTRTNAEGLDHDDSLRQPQPAGNCLNWVIGHILCSRNEMLVLLGESPIWSEAQKKTYERGSPPIVDGSAALPFERLLADLDRTQEILRQAITALTPEQLSAPLPEGRNPFRLDSVGEMLAAFSFHEAYHAGQTGILRRTLGREGAIN